MVTMLQIQEEGSTMVLREMWRMVERNPNSGTIRLSYESKSGGPYQPDNHRIFEVYFSDDDIWKSVKDAGAAPLFAIIDQAVDEYRELREAQDGSLPELDSRIADIVRFLADKEYTFIDVE